jgi:tRNA (guanine37-N1)-methyltransferase
MQHGIHAGDEMSFEFDVVTLFPEMFDAVRRHGITGRAMDKGICQLRTWNPRDFTSNNYRTVDDRPYGGGPGMVMLAAPLEAAINAAKQQQETSKVATRKVIYLSPQGRLLDHAGVMALGKLQGLVLVAGRYEGVDERVIQRCVDEEISIGDYVLSGGEIPAMVLIDALVRQMPGALGDADSAPQDSFALGSESGDTEVSGGGLLDCPHYTRPEVYDGEAVPAVLMSGNHADIARWRLQQSLGRTWQRRPDLLKQRGMNVLEHKLLEEFKSKLKGK